MKLEKMGMRTIKSGIAVMFCILAENYLIQDAFFAGAGCVVSMQDTVKGSVKSGFNRVKGTMIGGLIGFLLALIKPGDPIIGGIGIMIIIYSCNTLKLNAAIVVSCVTFLAIHLGVGSADPASYSIYRVIDTSVGVIIGVIVNYIIARPDYLESITIELKKIEEIAIESIEAKIINKEILDIERFEKQINHLEKVYLKLVAEMNYSKSNVDMETIERIIDLSKEIYFHMQSIELLENKLYLNNQNYNNIRNLYTSNEINWDLDEEESPVFNYHLNKIIEEIKEINRLNLSN